MPDLSTYDAWLLDSGLALRYSTIENEDIAERHHSLLQYMKVFMKVMGAKGIKDIKPYKRRIQPGDDDKTDDDIPELSAIFKMTGEDK